MDDLPQQLERRFVQMQSQRQPSEYIWKDCFDYLAPERSIGWFTGDTTNAAGSAQNQRARIFDGTGIDSGEVLKSNIASWMIPENSRWFSLDGGQDDEETTQWMDGAAQFLFEHIHSAGFSAVTGECFSDMVPAGWFVQYIDEARDSKGNVAGGFNFEQWPLYQCYVSCSKAAGRVDTIYRLWWPTVEQLVTEYGLDKVSDQTRKKYADGKQAELVECLWVIEPQAVGKAKAAYAKNLPFRSCHLERSQRHILREGGYHEFPCAVPRWRLIPGSPYATGKGSEALPDVKTLNDIIRMELMSLDLAVSGMWKATDDGVLNPKTIKVGPRKIVMMADINNFQPLLTGADFNVSFQKSDQLREQIRRIFMSNLLTPAGGPVRSATEIAQNMSQIRQLMAPILGRFQSEFLQVVIERCFNIALRAGALEAAVGPVPEGLQSYDVKYISPLARSQKMEEVNAIDAFAAGLFAAAQAAQDMTLLDGLKMDDAMYEKGLALGVPAKLLRGPDQLAEKRQMDAKNREAAQQRAQQQQLQQHAATTAVDTIAAA